jgi:hypothetical protein
MSHAIVQRMFMMDLFHTHLGFIFPKVFPCLLVIINHYLVSYIFVNIIVASGGMNLYCDL